MNNIFVLNLPISIIRHLILKIKFNLRVFWILSLISIMSFLAFYIFQINAVVSEGYQIQNYQKKINELLKENKLLEINSLKVNSLENIETRIQELGFEKIDRIYYLQVPETPMVTKK